MRNTYANERKAYIKQYETIPGKNVQDLKWTIECYYKLLMRCQLFDFLNSFAL